MCKNRCNITSKQSTMYISFSQNNADLHCVMICYKLVRASRIGCPTAFLTMLHWYIALLRSWYLTHPVKKRTNILEMLLSRRWPIPQGWVNCCWYGRKCICSSFHSCVLWCVLCLFKSQSHSSSLVWNTTAVFGSCCMRGCKDFTIP